VVTLVSAGPGCGSGGLPSLFGPEIPDAGSPFDAGTDAHVPHLITDSAPPTCNVGPEGGVCGCLDLPGLVPRRVVAVPRRAG